MIAIGVLAGGCATPTQSARERSDDSTAKKRPEESRPEQGIMRSLLIESGATFYAAVDGIDDTTVQTIVAALNNNDEQWSKIAFGKKIDAASLRKRLLRLASAETIIEGPYTLSTQEARRKLLALLDEPTVTTLVSRVIAQEKGRKEFCKAKNPRIHNIGILGVLTFESKGEEGSADANGRRHAVRIPFDGRDLSPRCVNVDVKITGTMPVSEQAWEKDFYVSKPLDDRLESGNTDSGTVLLKEDLLDRLRTGDKVTVQIVVSERGVYRESERRRVVSYATRTFTMYSVDDYREKILKNQIAIQDIRAFPLPESEVNKLFGPLISRNFFVVRLSVINRENEVKIISTGMITASGRAIVEPLANVRAEDTSPSFTVPVTVVPSSLQQTYAIVDDEEVDQIRPRNFRILEFTGSLLTAGTAAFGSSLAVAKGVGLFTGVVVPEAKRAVPDRWPGYKRNIVNFAAPDLLKVPGNTIADHKLLFFSKKDIELIVADQNLFIDNEDIFGDSEGVLFPKRPAAPKVRIISLAFDNLDIRFEKVFDAAILTVRQRVAALVASLPKRIDKLNSLDTQWTNGGRFGGTSVLLMDWKNLSDQLKPAMESAALKSKFRRGLEVLPDADKNDKVLANEIPEDLDRLTSIVSTFNPKGNTSGYRADLIANQDFGLNALNVSQARLNDFARVLTAGPDPSEVDVAAIEKTLQLNQKAIDFYETVVQLLNNAELLQSLKALGDTAEAAAKTEADWATADESKKQELAEIAKTAKEKFKSTAIQTKTTIELEIKNVQSKRPNGEMKIMKVVPWPAAGS